MSGGLPVVIPGQTFSVFGWAAKPETSAVCTGGTAFIDGVPVGTAKLLPRPDIASTFANPALALCGFEFTISAPMLERGEHVMTLSFTDDSGNETRGNLRFPIAPLPTGSTSRILVAAAPKSGSTYVSSVLQRYFGLEEPLIAGMHWRWEHNIDASTLLQLRDKSYVIQRHIRPYAPNVSAIMTEDISTIVTWRNLGDVVISLDDHVRREGGGVLYLFHMNDDAYLAMPDQARYQYMIQYALPWYINFYLGWKELRAPIFRYEDMASDRVRFFNDMIATIAGHVDRERLAAILESGSISGATRGNVGRKGRSAELFSEETRERLEQFLENHYEPLTELRDELPWRTDCVGV
jgi:hypothetical protein